MKIYGIQLNIVWENKAANHAKVRSLLTKASPARGSLVVLPEMFSTGFSMNVAGVVETEARETEVFLSRTAQEFGVYLLGGVATAAEGGRGRNQSVTFGPDGQELARYTKL